MKLAAVPMVLLLTTGPAVADYRMELSQTGMQDYYCSATIVLRNDTDAPLAEINGYLYVFVEEEKVGRSRGASFLDVAPGEQVEATFLTPNAPCEEITRYRFVVGACRLDGGFADPAICATGITAVAPIAEAVPR